MAKLVTIPHPSLKITAQRCGPADEEPLLDRLETLLHQDYFFRRNHFRAILARPQACVIAIRVEGEFAAIVILYNGSTLQNLYIHPEHKGQGVGRAVLEFFDPEVVRSKSNMSMGDPAGFYEKAGYHFAEADPHRPHIHLMTKNGQPPPPPAAAPKPPISDARRAQLDAARAKQAEKREAKKAAAAAAALAPAPPQPSPPTDAAAQPAVCPTGGGLVPAAASEPEKPWWPWPD